jgi:hypothetical protein
MTACDGWILVVAPASFTRTLDTSPVAGEPQVVARFAACQIRAQYGAQAKSPVSSSSRSCEFNSSFLLITTARWRFAT